MSIEISTPALLFPAASLLFLAYTNRHNHVCGVIRQLLQQAPETPTAMFEGQVDNLWLRLSLIRWMQRLIAISLLCCMVSMAGVLGKIPWISLPSFVLALVALGISLVAMLKEVGLSATALQLLLAEHRRDRMDGLPTHEAKPDASFFRQLRSAG